MHHWQQKIPVTAPASRHYRAGVIHILLGNAKIMEASVFSKYVVATVGIKIQKRPLVQPHKIERYFQAPRAMWRGHYVLSIFIYWIHKCYNFSKVLLVSIRGKSQGTFGIFATIDPDSGSMTFSVHQVFGKRKRKWEN